MDEQIKIINQEIDQFHSQLQLIDNSMKICILSVKLAKKYQELHSYNEQSAEFKFIFSHMSQAFQYLKQCLEDKRQLIKISDNGQLFIGIRQKNRINHLILLNKEVPFENSASNIRLQTLQQKLQRLERENLQMRTTIKAKQHQQLQNKQYLKALLAMIKLQVLSNSQKQTCDLSIMFNMFNRLQEDFTPTNKTHIMGFLGQNDLIKEEERPSIQKFNIICEQVTRDRSKTAIDKKQNDKQKQQSKIIQYKKQVIKDLQDQKTAVSYSSQYKLSDFPDYVFVPLTANMETNQFKKYHYFDKTRKYFQRVQNDACWRQVISQQQVLRDRKCFFQIQCLNSSNSDCFIGIVTEQAKMDRHCYGGTQAISYCLWNGKVWNNGHDQLVGAPFNSAGTVRVFVDIPNGFIIWHTVREKQAMTKISNIEKFKTSKLFVCVTTCYRGNKFAFKQ